MGQAVTILSRAEALKLPPQDRPLCYRVTNKIYMGVWESIGAASMCWQPRPSKEVFDTTQAEKVAIDLCFIIAQELERLGVTVEQISPAPAPLNSQPSTLNP